MTQSTVVNIYTTCFNTKTGHLAQTCVRARAHTHTMIYALRIILTVDTRFLLSLNRPERLCGSPTLLFQGVPNVFPQGKVTGARRGPLTSI